MKRRVIGGVAALAMIAVGGSAAWFWGKSRVEAEIDAQVAALSSRAAVSWSAREVSGFPTGYVVRLDDVRVSAADGSWRFAAPWVELVAGFDAPRRFVGTMAPEAEVVLTTAQGEPIELALAQDGLLVERNASESPVQTRIVIDRLTARTPEDASRSGRMEIEQADLLHISGAPGVHVFGGEIGALSGEARVELPRRRVVDASVRLDSARIEARATALDPSDLAAFVDAEGGGVEVKLQAASTSIETARRIAPDAAPFRQAFASGPASARLAVGSGRGALAAEAATPRYAGRLPGSITAERASLAVETPVAPAAPPEWSARIEIEGASPDAEMWSALDPDEALPREPASLSLELGGEAEIGGTRGPAVARTVEVREARLTGLGASAEASGSLRTSESGGAPDGAVTIRATGLEPLLDALTEAGLLAHDQRALADALLDLYAREDEATGELTAEIALRDGAVFANGQRLR